MKVTLHSTTRVVDVQGVPARVWEGQTASGIPVYCLITRVAVPPGQPTDEFEAELVDCTAPTDVAVRAFSTRLVL